jgi:hypothetical protein
MDPITAGIPAAACVRVAVLLAELLLQENMFDLFAFYTMDHF